MMKKLLCLLLALGVVFALCACGGETTTEDPSENKTTQATTTEATNTQQPEQDEEDIDDGKISYTVKVVDEAGNPVAAVDMVQVCDEANTCSIFMLKDGEGSMRLVEAEYHATLMKGLPEGYEYTTEETEFSFDSDYTCTIVLKAVA